MNSAGCTTPIYGASLKRGYLVLFRQTFSQNTPYLISKIFLRDFKPNIILIADLEIPRFALMTFNIASFALPSRAGSFTHISK